MSLLSTLLKESMSGGTSGGAIANSSGNLFGGQNGGTMIMRRMGYVPVNDLPSKKKKRRKICVSEGLDNTVKPYDYQETINKLDQAVKTAAENRDDVAVFGLEDDEGKIIKVFVNKDQADSFESALANMLADQDQMFVDDVEPKNATEIAEILFKLKSEFDIIDVEWGRIVGDEEEEEDTDVSSDEPSDLEGDDSTSSDEAGEGGDESGLEGEGLAGGDDVADESETEATSALQAVINMMQAEAKAKLADAEARKAEAEAAISAHAADAAKAKVSQEEDILAMKDHENAKKEAKKEAETLAKLAKYKKETSDDPDVGVPLDSVDKITSSSEQEEVAGGSAKVKALSKEQLADIIIKYARTQE